MNDSSFASMLVWADVFRFFHPLAFIEDFKPNEALTSSFTLIHLRRNNFNFRFLLFSTYVHEMQFAFMMPLQSFRSGAHEPSLTLMVILKISKVILHSNELEIFIYSLTIYLFEQ